MNDLDRFRRLFGYAVNPVFDGFRHGPGKGFIILMILNNTEQIPGIAYNKPVHLPFALNYIHHRRV
ncbi:hypothetical protein D3C75_1348440 [compost metagenome]